MEKLIRWSRSIDESLFLEVLENNVWVNYKQSKFYTPDAKTSSNSGFATAQKYLSLGFKYLRIIELAEYFVNRSSEDLFSLIQESILTKTLIQLDFKEVTDLHNDQLNNLFSLLRICFGKNEASKYLILNNATPNQRDFISKTLDGNLSGLYEN